MPTLYELTNELAWVMLSLQEEEEGESQREETNKRIEELISDITGKADGYAKVLRNLQSDMEAYAAEEQRLHDRRKACERGVERCKAMLKTAMEITGKTKIGTSIGTFTLQNNPASVEVLSEKDVPEEYWVPQPPRMDKRKILTDLKAGCIVDGVQLTQTTGVRFR